MGGAIAACSAAAAILVAGCVRSAVMLHAAGRFMSAYWLSDGLWRWHSQTMALYRHANNTNFSFPWSYDNLCIDVDLCCSRVVIFAPALEWWTEIGQFLYLIFQCKYGCFCRNNPSNGLSVLSSQWPYLSSCWKLIHDAIHFHCIDWKN